MREGERQDFTADKISYFQELILKETWEVIHQERDINKIFSNILKIYLHIFEASFPVCVSGSLSPRHGASSGCG